MKQQTFSGTPSEWNTIIETFPKSHFLQSAEWAKIKTDYDWKSLPQIWNADNGEIVAAALVLERSVRIPLLPFIVKVQYVPRGPLLSDWSNVKVRHQILQDLITFAKEQKALMIKIDPEISVGTGVPGSPDEVMDFNGLDVQQDLANLGWIFSSEQIQFRNTVLIDLNAKEDTLLAQMKQKTRYNVRLASRRGVVIREAKEDEYGLLYQMYAVTSVRDGFVIREESYYHQVWNTFNRAGKLKTLVAEVDGNPVAGLVMFVFAGRAWYVYGMSLETHREKMPNYLLQWEAMRQAKLVNCQEYDLWGAPDIFDERDSMWGVYRFKQGLGGFVQRTIGAWDYPVNPMLYKLYTRVLPKMLDIMRRRGVSRVQDQVHDVTY